MCIPVNVIAGNASPPIKDPGLSEKALRKSQPDYSPGPKRERELIESPATEATSATGPSFFIREIVVEGNALLPDDAVAAIVDVGAGRELTLGELKQITNQITMAYAEAGYLLVRAYLPQQEITDGRVTINILQGLVADISVTGNQQYTSDSITGTLDEFIDTTTLTESLLERSLLNLNDVYGVTARAVLTAGPRTGTTDMIINVEEGRRYRISLDADNFGSEFTGENRYGLSGQIASLFRFGDELSIRGLTTNGEQDYINAAYRIPLLGLNTYLHANYIYANQQLGANLTPLAAKGESNIGSLSLSHYWQRTRNHEVAFNGGVAVRFFNNDLLGTKTSDDRLANLFVSVNGFFNDRFNARTYYGIKLQKGLTETDRGDVLNSRLNGRGNGLIASFNLTRYQPALWLDSYFVLKAEGQLADRRMLSPDLYAAGGMGTVRGYPLAEIVGDNAYLLSAEYVLPLPIKNSLIEGWPGLNKMVSLFGFIDHSGVFTNQRLPGETNKFITGAGVGIRLNIEPPGKQLPNISFMMAYGKPVLGSQTPSDGEDGIFYLGGILSY